MRRSTAAVVGTLSGAALIVGVRLSVEPPAAPVAAPPAVDLANSTPSAKPPAKKPAGEGGGEDAGKDAGEKKEKENAGGEAEAPPKSGLKDGVFKGAAVKNVYGTVQVQIRIDGGEITAAEATYPTGGDSSTINPPAVEALKASTLTAQSAEVDAVSGATFTTESYKESLQAALDAAKA